MAGVDPAALVESINQAQADRAAAQAESTSPSLTPADVHAMIDSLGDVGAMLSEAHRESLARSTRNYT